MVEILKRYASMMQETGSAINRKMKAAARSAIGQRARMWICRVIIWIVTAFRGKYAVMTRHGVKGAGDDPSRLERTAVPEGGRVLPKLRATRCVGMLEKAFEREYVYPMRKSRN